jgi:hypothetical protein
MGTVLLQSKRKLKRLKLICAFELYRKVGCSWQTLIMYWGNSFLLSFWRQSVSRNESALCLDKRLMHYDPQTYGLKKNDFKYFSLLLNLLKWTSKTSYIPMLVLLYIFLISIQYIKISIFFHNNRNGLFTLFSIVFLCYQD